jgi:hypothetical protein
MPTLLSRETQPTYMARAIVTAPVIFSTAAGTGGPLLWNPGATLTAPNKAVARLLKIGCAVTTASTVAGSLGLTGGFQGTTAPSSTTTIDSSANMTIGDVGHPSQVNVYRVGTPAAAGSWFLPIFNISTAALTAEGDNLIYYDITREILVTLGPPRSRRPCCKSRSSGKNSISLSSRETFTVPTNDAYTLQTLTNSPQFRLRVKNALGKIGGNMIDPSITPGATSTSRAYARTVLGNLDQYTTTMCGWLINRPNVIATTITSTQHQGQWIVESDVTDAALESQINSDWPLIAGG